MNERILTALLALADKWEGAIQVAYNDYSYGQRTAYERAVLELRETISNALDVSDAQQ